MKTAWILVLIFSWGVVQAQSIPDDEVTASMKQYLHALNGGEVSPEKLTKQLEFMQKVRGIWENPRFNELRQKPLREIIEHNIGHDLFISAVAFSEESIEDRPREKTERVQNILNRAIRFRRALRELGDDHDMTIHRDGKPVSVWDEVGWMALSHNPLRTVFRDDGSELLVLSHNRWDVIWLEGQPKLQISNVFEFSTQEARDHGAEFVNAFPSMYGFQVCHVYDRKLVFKHVTGETVKSDWPIIDEDRIGFSPQQLSFVTASPDHFFIFGHLMDGKIKVGTRHGMMLTEHKHQVHSLIFNEHRRMAASVDSEGVIKLWNWDTKQPIATWFHEYREGNVWANQISFSPDGKFLISAGNNREAQEPDIKIFDLDSLQEFKYLKRHEAPLTTMAMTPDGSYIISGDQSGRVLVWDMTTFNVVGELNYGKWITSLSIAPDGSRLAIGMSNWILKKNEENLDQRIYVFDRKAFEPPNLGLIYMGDRAEKR